MSESQNPFYANDFLGYMDRLYKTWFNVSGVVEKQILNHQIAASIAKTLMKNGGTTVAMTGTAYDILENLEKDGFEIVKKTA